MLVAPDPSPVNVLIRVGQVVVLAALLNPWPFPLPSLWN